MALITKQNAVRQVCVRHHPVHMLLLGLVPSRQSSFRFLDRMSIWVAGFGTSFPDKLAVKSSRMVEATFLVTTVAARKYFGNRHA